MIKQEIDEGKKNVFSKLLCGKDANLVVQKQIVCVVKRCRMKKAPQLSALLLLDQKARKNQGGEEHFPPKSGFRSVAFPQRCRILLDFSGKWQVT